MSVRNRNGVLTVCTSCEDGGSALSDVHIEVEGVNMGGEEGEEEGKDRKERPHSVQRCEKSGMP